MNGSNCRQVRTIRSVRPTSIAMQLELFSSENTYRQLDQFTQLPLQRNSRYFHHWKRSSIYLSYSRFYCNETRFIFISGYVAVITLVIPASIAVILAAFSSPYTLQYILIVIPASTAVKHAQFSLLHT